MGKTKDVLARRGQACLFEGIFLNWGKIPSSSGPKIPSNKDFFLCLFQGNLPNQLLQNPHHINKLNKGIKDKVQRETYLGFRNECYIIFPIANKREYNIVRNSSFSIFQWYKSRDIENKYISLLNRNLYEINCCYWGLQ